MAQLRKNGSKIFILCSHMTTMDSWRATNADKMATNSGQPGELQPCKFSILKSFSHLADAFILSDFHLRTMLKIQSSNIAQRSINQASKDLKNMFLFIYYYNKCSRKRWVFSCECCQEICIPDKGGQDQEWCV